MEIILKHFILHVRHILLVYLVKYVINMTIKRLVSVVLWESSSKDEDSVHRGARGSGGGGGA